MRKNPTEQPKTPDVRIDEFLHELRGFRQVFEQQAAAAAYRETAMAPPSPEYVSALCQMAKREEVDLQVDVRNGRITVSSRNPGYGLALGAV